LINALRHADLPLPEDLEKRIEKIGIDSQRRPETLTIQDFARLADALRS
jgi:16S rRNA A1518/A1519 N6-dimethyltransferase RsmA/KsgA/DIM1 with predicted DNA glycosylase/AP lyase activity